MIHNTTIRRTVAAIILFGLAMITTACNTIEGVGRDIEATGEAIGDAAEDAKD